MSQHPHAAHDRKWCQLITTAEALRQRSGWGLASFWENVRADDYEAARDSLERVAGCPTVTTPTR